MPWLPQLMLDELEAGPASDMMPMVAKKVNRPPFCLLLVVHGRNAMWQGCMWVGIADPRFWLLYGLELPLPWRQLP